MDPAIIAILSALFGGAGLKIVEKLLDKGKSNFDMATQLRSELRSDIDGLRDRLQVVEDEAERWRTKYYDLYEAFMALKIKLIERGYEEEVSEIEERFKQFIDDEKIT
jgi:hypothetical protein